MVLLTEGNAAKLYCLNWIEGYLAQKNGAAVRILDLGCGRAGNFVELLRKYPNVRYLGIEPSPSECEIARKNLTGLNGQVINGFAYDIYGSLVQEQFDLIVSFSVFEHVFRRQEYLNAVKPCLKSDGFFLINYDAGHFIQPVNLRERIKNWVGPVLGRLGQERYFQAFVPEADFLRMAKQAGFKIVEARSFNTHLKGIYKIIPPGDRTEFMQRWLAFEEWLNTLDIPYDDQKARSWFTRNFILVHAS